ncbi:MAG: hypothetical protein DWQ31_13825 [Planctomycetota bacterium]|nr:MAG: hypothetical protein DWQ31_13825 [Planctomycetota bacterium]REJ90980.1 MAG: hypothetical protein DWQ35_15415 [Planctomycetota bacterium]REK25462.1 MAG: hypothetical protein DWQ42_11145 [Planctomycetota bacterium]REK40834.1 MAG: hypothetical protein DWQ46_15175 [Planctomycetota bacterium]
MRRHALGVLALLFLAGGLLLVARPQLAGNSASFYAGVGIRVGAVLGVLWLAYPHLDFLPQALLVALVAAGVVLATRRGLFPIAVVLIAAILILRPRSGRSTRGTNGPRPPSDGG